MNRFHLKRIISVLLAVLVVGGSVLMMSACGNSGNSGTSGDANSGNNSGTNSSDDQSTASESNSDRPELEPGVLNISLGAEPESLDPAINYTVDGSTMLVHLFSGLAKWAKDGNGNLTVIADSAERLTEGKSNDDGTVTYTYKLKEGLKWSDGEAVKASDFAYAWQRASRSSTGGAYYYLFGVIDGYNDSDPSAELNVKATDDRTLEVTLAGPCSYWDELLALPPFFPVKEGAASDSNWAKDASTYVTNGPYKMTSWDHGSEIVLEKNPDFYDAAAVTMEKLDFHLTEDSANMVGNFRTGEWQFIDDVPIDQIKALRKEFPNEFSVKGEDSTYYMCWNIGKNILPANSELTGAEAEKARAEIRQALGLLIDRNYIVEEITRAGQVPASSFVAMGVIDYDGTEFYLNANKAAGNDYVGYYRVTESDYEENRNQAIETLKKYYNYDEATGTFTNFPPITYLYNTSGGHQAIGEFVQQIFTELGIELGLIEQDFNSFMESRNNGEFTIARNSWMADYNDPICYLEMWTTTAGNNDVQFGRDSNRDVNAYSLDLTDLGYEEKIENGTWAETYDMLIGKIRKETDKEKRHQLMHRAEDLLMETGCICPLFYFTDIYMADSRVTGYYSNPLGYKYFMTATTE